MKRFNLIMPAVLVAAAFLLLAFVVPQDQKKGEPWNIPDNYLKMKNPLAADDAAMINVGKTLYAKHCRSCHGNAGLGDGVKAKQLKTFPGDFSSEAFHNLSDGAIYYKSFIGRDEMPNFEKSIPDMEDRWAIVTYIRATCRKK
ncbi:MAG: cytochrome c [Bacteroidales bacterium]|nr:cytochrome c [Bacteroidales bacterium]